MPDAGRTPPNPSPVLVIIGSAGSVRAAYEALACLGSEAPPIAGALVVDTQDSIDASDLPIPILGEPGDLRAIHEKMCFGRALVCIPSSLGELRARVRDDLRALGVVEHHWQSIRDALTQHEGAASIGGTVDVGALIDRSPRSLDQTGARGLIGGRRVLITGAGGSIGSELARRCARLDPEAIILMERSENALFEIDRQLRETSPDIQRETLLHDVVDQASTRRLVQRTRPHVIFHAAAHKHVPMMEDHPAAAITNNLFGTRSIALAAMEAGAERFVMISSEKAVLPKSVMGASKWLAEQYVRSLASDGPTKMSIVRFGNVLGSAGSVLPIWAAQVERGGAITVTHPDMTRYFMTIPEAASLVIQAASIDHPGPSAPVYVLDMGEPVRIGDLADRFIRAAGRQPRWPEVASLGGPNGCTVVEIKVTGIRPGEKLHEQLAHASEPLSKTQVEGVLVLGGALPDESWVVIMISELGQAQGEEDSALVIQSIARFVPELSSQIPNKKKILHAA